MHSELICLVLLFVYLYCLARFSGFLSEQYGSHSLSYEGKGVRKRIGIDRLHVGTWNVGPIKGKSYIISGLASFVFKKLTGQELKCYKAMDSNYGIHVTIELELKLVLWMTTASKRIGVIVKYRSQGPKQSIKSFLLENPKQQFN